MGRSAPRRRAPGSGPLIEPVAPQGHGETGRQDVDGHAAHHLITPVGDGGEAVQQGEQDGDPHPDPQPNPGGTGDGGGRRTGEGGGQQLALQGDVDHPERSQNIPAIAARMSGGAVRMVASSIRIKHFEHDQAPFTWAAGRLAKAR